MLGFTCSSLSLYYGNSHALVRASTLCSLSVHVICLGTVLICPFNDCPGHSTGDLATHGSLQESKNLCIDVIFL